MIATTSGNTYSALVPLELGVNTLTVRLSRPDRTYAITTLIVNGALPPVVAFTSPTQTIYEAPPRPASAWPSTRWT